MINDISSTHHLRYMLDTDSCIYVMKNRPASVKNTFVQRQYQLCISSVVMMELLAGAEKSEFPERNRLAVYDFTRHFPILDFDVSASAETAQIKAKLELAGVTIGAYDVMIAGHARSLGLAVVTNNVREFGRIEGLLVENWVK